jgi:AcrR family transcriptional regulator
MVLLSRRPSRKNDMLNAAVDLVARHGIDALTIDGLAEATGATKGGVQYHFPSKAGLFTETLEFLLQAFDEAIEARAASLSGPGRWLRAYVELSTGMIADVDRVAGAMLAVLPPDDARAAPFRRCVTAWRTRAESDGVDAATALVVRLAADSLWTERVFGGATDADAELVRNRLFTLLPQTNP